MLTEYAFGFDHGAKSCETLEITLPKDANIHAREYQFYLPSKEELQRKLEEWIEGQPADHL